MSRFFAATAFLLLALFCLLRPANAADDAIRADAVLIRLIDQVDVPARALGALTAVHAGEGTRVEKGDLLAQIDDAEARLEQRKATLEVAIAEHEAGDDVEVRSAQKSRDFARDDYLRLQRADAARPRSVSASEMEKSRLEAELAELEIERGANALKLADLKRQLAQNRLELALRSVEVRQILAPLSGVVVEVVAHPGEWVQPGDKIFQIVRTDRLRAEGFLDASQVSDGLRGAAVELIPMLGERPGPSVSGIIVFVSPEIDPINGQVRVWAEVDNPEGRLRPGLRADMIIRPSR